MNPAKTIVIDSQLFQTAAWHRGMGRYSLSLLRQLFADRLLDYEHVILLFNRNLKFDDARLEEIRAVFVAYKPEVVMVTLPDSHDGRRPDAQHRDAKRAINYWAESQFQKQPFDYLILSHFTFDYFAVFPDRARVKALIFYDLIPYVLWSDYNRYFPGDAYFERFCTIFEANYLAGISQTTIDDLVARLGVDPQRTAQIGGAPIESTVQKALRPKDFGNERFILLPSADYPHKNNLRAVEGFARFNEQFGNQFKLVVTSFVSERSRAQLSARSDDLIFTGNITESELDWLFDHAELILFPSEIEGLGLPVLEAMAKGRPVACSAIPVFKEISEQAFYMFDPHSSVEITSALMSAVTHQDWEHRHAQYAPTLKKYSWRNSAKAFASGLKQIQDHMPLPSAPARPRVAIVCPHPISGSPLAQFMQYFYSALNELWDIEYYFDAGHDAPGSHPAYIDRIARANDVGDFTLARYHATDAVLYVIDDTKYSARILRAALALPGFVLLGAGNLEFPLTQLVDEGLISSHAAKLEKSFAQPEAAGLASMVNQSCGVLTMSAEVEQAVRGQLDPDIPVKNLGGLPSSYSEYLKFDVRKLAHELAEFCRSAASPNDELARILRSPGGIKQLDAKIKVYFEGRSES